MLMKFDIAHYWHSQKYDTIEIIENILVERKKC